MTTDISVIMKCVSADGPATCTDECKFRKGKEVASNTDLDLTNKDLFASNFCHPPTTDNWEQAAPKCLDMETQTTCESAQCVWSTGKEFAPESSFCSAAEISKDAMTFKTCADTTEDACIAPLCKWNTVEPKP
jgi:hypothetical protein